MNEFSQILTLLKQELCACDKELKVFSAFVNLPRQNPQHSKVAVVGIQKVALTPMGLENYYGDEKLPFGRKAQVHLKVSFCCKSGEECWKLWESCAQRLIFSKELKVGQMECGEVSWQKDWGGMVLPVKLCCDFIISGTADESASGIHPDSFQIIRKGVIG